MRAAAVALTALALAGCTGGRDDGDLVVSAAASLRAPLSDCTNDSEEPRIRLQLGGSGELAAQIRKGVRPDVYAAADDELPERLAREGLLERPLVFATNRLVLAARTIEVDGLADLERDGIRLVIGSEGVPIGDYTRELLDRLPEERERAILANVASEEPDVKGIVAKLARGAGSAGFLYLTDLKAAKLKPIQLPDRLQPEIAYGAGVVDGSERPEDARAFVAGLRSGPCAAALRAAGFGRPPR